MGALACNDPAGQFLRYVLAGGVVDVAVDRDFHTLFPDRPCWRLVPSLLIHARVLVMVCPDFSSKLREVVDKGDPVALETLLQKGACVNHLPADECCGEPDTCTPWERDDA